MRSILRRDKGRGGPTGREITRGGYGRGVPATRTVYVQVAVVLGITRGDLRALAVTLEEGSPSRRSCGGHCRDSPSRPPPVARSLTLGMGAGTLTPSHLNSLTVKHFHSSSNSYSHSCSLSHSHSCLLSHSHSCLLSVLFLLTLTLSRIHGLATNFTHRFKASIPLVCAHDKKNFY